MAVLKIKKPGSIAAILKSVLDLGISEPKVFVPFLILAGFEIFSLWLLSCSPHFPVSVLLAPPIKNIWGANYLHYPAIYELLPRLLYYSKIVLGIFVGSLTSGMAVLMIKLLAAKQKADLKSVFSSVFKCYVSLILLMAFLYVCVHFVMKQPAFLLVKYFRSGHPKLLFLGPKFWGTMFLPVLNFVLAVILQGLFVFAIPYIVIKGKKFLIAIILGIKLFFRLFLKTVFLAGLPMLLYIPITMLRSNFGFLADKFFPEVIIIILFIGILVGTVVVDSLVTLSTTLLFIEAANEE